MRLKRQTGGRRQKRGWEGVTSRFGGHTGHSRDLTLSGDLGQTSSYPGVSAFSPKHWGERCVVQLAGSEGAT